MPAAHRRATPSSAADDTRSVACEMRSDFHGIGNRTTWYCRGASSTLALPSRHRRCSGIARTSRNSLGAGPRRRSACQRPVRARPADGPFAGREFHGGGTRTISYCHRASSTLAPPFQCRRYSGTARANFSLRATRRRSAYRKLVLPRSPSPPFRLCFFEFAPHRFFSSLPSRSARNCQRSCAPPMCSCSKRAPPGTVPAISRKGVREGQRVVYPLCKI
jgi:hypothetical protein